MSYFKRVVNCVQLRLKQYQVIGFENQTVTLTIDIENVSYSMGREIKEQLFTLGYQQTKEYFDKRKKQKKTLNTQTINTTINKNLEEEINLLLKEFDY